MKTSSLFVLFLLLALSLMLTACNTIRGVGEDISGSASFVERKMSGMTDSDATPSNPPQWPKQ